MHTLFLYYSTVYSSVTLFMKFCFLHGIFTFLPVYLQCKVGDIPLNKVKIRSTLSAYQQFSAYYVAAMIVCILYVGSGYANWTAQCRDTARWIRESFDCGERVSFIDAPHCMQMSLTYHIHCTCSCSLICFEHVKTLQLVVVHSLPPLPLLFPRRCS